MSEEQTMDDVAPAPEGVIENTPEAWSDALRKLADEARADAAQRDSSTVLAEILDDLWRVLDSYALRLDGVERTVRAAAVVAPDVAAEVTGLATPVLPNYPTDLADRVAALEALALQQPAEPFDLPGWIRDTLQDHHDRLWALEQSIVALTGRLTALENNANLTAFAPAETFMADAPIDPNDYNPESWGSIERARQALNNRVRREHTERAAIRQTVLNAVVHLAQLQEADPLSFSDDDRAQLRQQRARADRLAEIDVIRDVKLDEIAALDDLENARSYGAERGWPE